MLAQPQLDLRLHPDSDCESDIGITTWYASIVAAGLWDAIDVLAECKCTLTSLTPHLDFDELSLNDWASESEFDEAWEDLYPEFDERPSYAQVVGVEVT